MIVVKKLLKKEITLYIKNNLNYISCVAEMTNSFIENSVPAL